MVLTFFFFLKIKYVGDEQEKSIQMTGLNLVNKTLFVQDARIAFSIWDVGGLLINKFVFGLFFSFLAFELLVLLFCCKQKKKI